MSDKEKCVVCGKTIDAGFVEFMATCVDTEKQMKALNALEQQGIKIQYDEKGNPETYVCPMCLLKALGRGEVT